MLVSGTTESRLNEILPLGKEPTAGQDGVLQVRENLVRYKIGSILYEDSNGVTTYTYYPQRPYNKRDSFVTIPFDSSYLGIDGSRLNIVRSGIPVFQTIFNLDFLENSDVDAFPLNFF